MSVKIYYFLYELIQLSKVKASLRIFISCALVTDGLRKPDFRSRTPWARLGTEANLRVDKDGGHFVCLLPKVGRIGFRKSVIYFSVASQCNGHVKTTERGKTNKMKIPFQDAGIQYLLVIL